MVRASPSALIIDQGRRVLLRVQERLYELSQEELRAALGLPDGPPGLGITINNNRLRFEFALDQQAAEVTADELRRRLSKQLAAKS